jgi:hypothetical protein
LSIAVSHELMVASSSVKPVRNDVSMEFTTRRICGNNFRG